MANFTTEARLTGSGNEASARKKAAYFVAGEGRKRVADGYGRAEPYFHSRRRPP